MGRMAKLMSNVKVTVENEDVKFIFNTETAGISSVDGGFTHDLTVGRLFNAQKIIIQSKEAPVTPETPAPSPSELTNEQQNGINVILAAAKAMERQKFMNACALDAAIREADKLTADAEHKFNMAVLQTIHTGLSMHVIDEVLEDENFGDLTEKTGYVAALDTPMLYQTEA